MRSTHEQTVRYQNKCSRSGCVSWDVCTEISLMVISFGKHVDILEALFSSVSVLDLFLPKFQYLVNSFMRIAASPASAVCGTLRSRVSARAISSSRSPMCVYVRCLAPELCSVGVAGPLWRFSDSLQLEIKFWPKGERPPHSSPLSAYLAITPHLPPTTSQTCLSIPHLVFSFPSFNFLSYNFPFPPFYFDRFFPSFFLCFF